MPRPKAQYSLAKNQMQLAMALSSSLEESNKRELSDLTEELPASTIENGIIPSNIKQMQKDFLEQLQMPRPGPSKKSKKPPKPVPTLTIRSSDERLRIITEKVALVLIKDDSIPFSFDNEIKPKQFQDDGKESMLWTMSATSPSRMNRSSYYIESLTMFVSPSKVTNSSKLNSTAFIPKRFKTPVKCRSGKNFLANNHLLSSPNEEVETDFNQWSSYDQRETETIDHEYRAQLELQNDWQRMLHNSSMSDITIVVLEKVKVWAHKLVLFARCPAMIDDLDGNVLHWDRVPHVQALAFLEFLYCGKLAPTHALGEDVNGVVFLAKKYKVTELLKFILASNINNETTILNNGDLLNWNSCNENAVDNRTISPDLFANPEKLRVDCELQTSVKTTVSKNHVNSEQMHVKAVQPCEMPIEISSEEEGDELLNNFFGTYNPAVCSPPVCSSFFDRSQTGHSPKTIRGTESQSEPHVSKPKLEMSNISPSLTESFHENSLHVSKLKSQNSLKERSCLINCSKAYKHTEIGSEDDLFSPLKLHDYKSPRSRSTSPKKRMTSLRVDDECILKNNTATTFETMEHKLSDFISDEEPIDKVGTKKKGNPSFSIMANSPRSKSNLNCLTATKNSRKSLFQTPTKKDDQHKLNEPHFLKGKCGEEFSPKSPPSFSKRKQSYSDNSDDNSPLSKRLCSLNDRVDETESSSSGTIPSPYKFESPQFSQCQDKSLLSSFILNTSVSNSEHVFLTPNTNSPRKSLDLDETENYYSSPKIKKTLSPCKNSVGHEKKLLDDSFNFNINDSVLLKRMQTPELKSKQITPLHLTRLRTPLDNVKTSSPVTPLPDYNDMSDEEFQAELLKFGLKRSLSRSKGIRMLQHIYEKLHPLVEVVMVDGKERLIPLGEKSPTAKRAYLPSCAPTLQDVDECDDQSDNDALSQQSNCSSGDDDIMLEETLLEEDVDLSQGVTSRDLKKAVHTWITSQPEIHEMILSYEPIWLDSFHDEIKSKFKTNIKINQLMDILDEEGITFRVAQGQRNVRRKKPRTPKKKHAPAKNKQTSPKATQSSSPRKQTM